MTRAVMWMLLATVAAAAAVLSFSALRDLALLCGFDRSLAWLLPVVVDAGAAAGCLVWLSAGQIPRTTSGVSRRFARTLTWLLLASSVVGNALVHGLTAYHLQPAWWIVVMVSAAAPAVLGAVVHLSVLVSQFAGAGNMGDDTAQEYADNEYPLDPVGELLDSGLGRRRLAAELGVSEYEARKLLAARNGTIQ